MKRTPLIYKAGATVLALGLMPLAVQAQPDTNAATKAENPPNWERGNRGGRANLTPEQRAERMRQMRRQALKNAMTASGIVDANVQEAVLDFVQNNQQEQAKINEAYRRLNLTFNGRPRERINLTDEEVTEQLKNLRAAVQAEKERRTAAASALDAKIQYTKNARLDAFLTVNGLIGDETFYTQGNPGGAPGAWFGGRQNNNGNRRNQGGLGGNGQPANP